MPWRRVFRQGKLEMSIGFITRFVSFFFFLEYSLACFWRMREENGFWWKCALELTLRECKSIDPPIVQKLKIKMHKHSKTFSFAVQNFSYNNSESKVEFTILGLLSWESISCMARGDISNLFNSKFSWIVSTSIRLRNFVSRILSALQSLFHTPSFYSEIKLETVVFQGAN